MVLGPVSVRIEGGMVRGEGVSVSVWGGRWDGEGCGCECVYIVS